MANPVKIKAVTEEVLEYGPGVYKVRLTPHSRMPRFKAGQFLHLTVDEYDPCGDFWPESRVFSIASRPDQKEICIVYSVKGKYTTKMQTELKPGKEVWLKFPYGDFCIDQEAAHDVLLVAGGTGVSPYMPYITSNPSGRVHVMYGVRQPQHLLFCDEFEQALTACSGLSMDIYIEHDSGIPLVRKANQHQGMLSIAAIKSKVDSMVDPLVYLSGPPLMIKSFRDGLVELGLSLNAIKIDAWE